MKERPPTTRRTPMTSTPPIGSTPPVASIARTTSSPSVTSTPSVASAPVDHRADVWEAEHRAVDRRLREYARHRSALDAAEALDLVRAEQFKLYALVGCSSHYGYMERVLGYGPHVARERMRVARALVRLPATTAAMARGELSYSAVRELTRVATDET